MPPNPYTPVDWVDQVTLVSEPNMDHIEGGIKNITDYGAGLDTRLLVLEGRPVVPAVVNGLWLKGSGGSAVWTQIAETDVANLVSDLAAKENAANKGVSSGYASLGSDGKVPAAQLPPASGAG